MLRGFCCFTGNFEILRRAEKIRCFTTSRKGFVFAAAAAADDDDDDKRGEEEKTEEEHRADEVTDNGDTDADKVEDQPGQEDDHNFVYIHRLTASPGSSAMAKRVCLFVSA